MHKLVIEDDQGKAVAVPLIRDEITVGRQEGNTIRLTERNVSRRHARLLRRDGVYFVEDLSSYTGTKVNGVAISGSVPLGDGDQLTIGPGGPCTIPCGPDGGAAPSARTMSPRFGQPVA